MPNCTSFLVIEAERKHVRRRARFQQRRDGSCHKVLFLFPARQGAEGNSRHSDKNIRGNMHHRMPQSKIGWPSLNVVIFPPVFAGTSFYAMFVNYGVSILCSNKFICN